MTITAALILALQKSEAMILIRTVMEVICLVLKPVTATMMMMGMAIHSNQKNFILRNQGMLKIIRIVMIMTAISIQEPQK